MSNSTLEKHRIHVQETAARAAVWGTLYILFSLTFYGAFVVDLVQRWGGPLILEWTPATVVWVTALFFSRVVRPIANTHIKHFQHHERAKKILG